MPKRKRGAGTSLRDALGRYQDEVFRALKTSKGFERQRLSKRLRDQGITPDKTQRLEREIAVLKSLDLHQTARAHLHLSLLKVKSIAASPDLPDELRRGVSKPDLPAEEQAALHNVTSSLYNRDPVRQAIDRAVKAVCSALDVLPPETGKRSCKDKRQVPDEQSSDRKQSSLGPSGTASEATDGGPHDDDDEESEFEGFSSHDDGPIHIQDESDSDGEEDDEKDFETLHDLLGSASEEEEDWDDEKYAQFRGKETVNLDDISLSGSGSGSGSENGDVEAEREAGTSSSSPTPPVDKIQKTTKKASSALKPGQIGGSTFLPSLMGGYISGSESASDIEDARPKKRRGQRARQAIWEQKYGSSAKHLQKPSHKGGRDSGCCLVC
ncbi:hypothetical protein E4U53_007218 [Claviceps sorghi]|nr:hypothetical protein E4U53_007218 [Claviceps sorghi]